MQRSDPLNPLQIILLKKIQSYLAVDNPIPNSMKDSVFLFFGGHSTGGRNSANAFYEQYLSKNQSLDNQFIAEIYAFMNDTSEPGKTLRERIGEGLCEYFGIEIDRIQRKKSDIVTGYVRGLGVAIPDHLFTMMAIRDLLNQNADFKRVGLTRAF